MAPPDESNGIVASTSATERTPLLRDGRQGGDAAEAQNGEAGSTQEVEGSDIPIAKEPNARELILILGSIWLGVFLAALGTFISPFGFGLSRVRPCC